jgi:hypothetical protein
MFGGLGPTQECSAFLSVVLGVEAAGILILFESPAKSEDFEATSRTICAPPRPRLGLTHLAWTGHLPTASVVGPRA